MASNYPAPQQVIEIHWDEPDTGKIRQKSNIYTQQESIFILILPL